MHQQIRFFVNGFVIILIIMIALALVAFQINNNADSSVNKAVTNQLEKINLSQELSATSSKRTQLIQSFLLKKENALNDSDNQELKKLDHDFKQASEKLLPLLNAHEGEILLNVNRLNKQISDLNSQVLMLIENGSHNDASQVLLLEALPETDLLLLMISNLIDLQRSNSKDVLSLAYQTSDDNRLRFVLYAVFSILGCLLMATLAVYFGNKMSGQLEEMNDYLEEKVSERTESLLDTQKELLEDNNELTRLASTDPLTGLFNRTYMNDVLKREYSRYQRYRQIFGIIIIDVDHFKQVNDSHGHDVGDLILTQIAHQLKTAVRNSDFVGRWGGEEFLICCTTIETGDIEAIAENIRIAIAETEFGIIKKLTISLGCAIIQPQEEIGSLIKRSDIALYQAKNDGRNQTMVSAVNN